jgi:hypothetical protein
VKNIVTCCPTHHDARRLSPTRQARAGHQDRHHTDSSPRSSAVCPSPHRGRLGPQSVPRSASPPAACHLEGGAGLRSRARIAAPP